ncbi:hypothetical protein PYWP30_02161 [Pyrobaculum sp. WP30]|nr:hypothetical protein PYWP30_02161 [Pyrobaculum sp. WP30]
MELNKIKQRLELALRPVEKPPTLEEVLEEVSTRGVLRGPVDWVFPAWMLYVDYVVQKIAESFQLTEEEKAQLLQFRHAMRRLLLDMWKQTKEKLTALHKAVVEGMFKIERGRLYAPGAWMYINANTPHIKINDISTSARFSDVLKLPHERLELFQLGWRASDESQKKRWPDMETAQPWQVFAWVATRYGDVYIRAAMVNLTHEGVSASIHIIARSWRHRWSKAEAISLVVDYLRRGEWAPLFTAWLGDGNARWSKVLRGKYILSIAAKESWRLGLVASTYEALVATGREAFVKLREAADVYGELLDLLKAHKWTYIKLATDDGLRVAYKLMKEREKAVLRLKESLQRIRS